MRVTGYRMMGYKISSGAQIGIGTLIIVKSATIGRATIGRGNRFSGDCNITIGDDTLIEHGNEFWSYPGAAVGLISIGSRVHITSMHMFDGAGGLRIGSDTRIAGRRSQFWTHGGQRRSTELVIGDECYIGSGVLIAQGLKIANNCFIGLGSVVVSSIETPGSLVSGNPARVLKTGITARLSLVENRDEAPIR